MSCKINNSLKKKKARDTKQDSKKIQYVTFEQTLREKKTP